MHLFALIKNASAGLLARRRSSFAEGGLGTGAASDRSGSANRRAANRAVYGGGNASRSAAACRHRPRPGTHHVPRIAEDLERIGDLAKNIAKRATTVASGQFTDDIVDGIEKLAALAANLLKEALGTFFVRDAERELAVRSEDERIDIMHTEIFRSS